MAAPPRAAPALPRCLLGRSPGSPFENQPALWELLGRTGPLEARIWLEGSSLRTGRETESRTPLPEGQGPTSPFHLLPSLIQAVVAEAVGPGTGLLPCRKSGSGGPGVPCGPWLPAWPLRPQKPSLLCEQEGGKGHPATPGPGRALCLHLGFIFMSSWVSLCTCGQGELKGERPSPQPLSSQEQAERLPKPWLLHVKWGSERFWGGWVTHTRWGARDVGGSGGTCFGASGGSCWAHVGWS